MTNRHYFYNRRHFMQAMGAMTMATGLPALPAIADASRVTIVIVGGGIGGCSVAIQLRQRLAQARIILVEKNSHYFADCYNNLALVGEYPFNGLIFPYDAIRRLGIEWVQDTAIGLEQKQVILKNQKIDFDFAVFATGVAFDEERFIEGVTPAALPLLPHAFSGRESAWQLKQRFSGLKNGEVVAVIPPPSPSRCPPAIYSRVGLLAHYMQNNLPDSKIIIFDSKDNFPLQTFFDTGWTSYYGGRIEWLANDAGGLIEAIEPDKNIIHTEFGQESVALINYLPPQFAGKLAVDSGLTDKSGWCPVAAPTMESTQRTGVYVIGDAVAGTMPKAASCATAQATLAAQAIFSAVGSAASESVAFIDSVNYVCYSYITPSYAFLEQGEYRALNNQFFRHEQRFSALQQSHEQARQVSQAGFDFFNDGMNDLFGDGEK